MGIVVVHHGPLRCAHFSFVVAWRYTLRIFVIFLRSQNSIKDQPNDNAINPMISSGYGSRIALGRSAAPGVPLSCPDVNLLLSQTWDDCKVHARPAVEGSDLKLEGSMGYVGNPLE